MSVRFRISMNEALYRRLRKELPSKRISAFIEAAVRARFHPDRAALDAAYRAAARETWRGRIESEWSKTETEYWPA